MIKELRDIKPDAAKITIEENNNVTIFFFTSCSASLLLESCTKNGYIDLKKKKTIKELTRNG